MKLQHVLQAFTGTPWAITPEKLKQIAAVLELRASGGRMSQDEIRAAIGDGGNAPRPANRGSVAVIPIQGTLVPRADAMDESSGLLSLAKVGAWFDAAVQDDSVVAIVLDVDSPGGAVSGTPELAAKIFAARGTKPIIAVANGMMASAAYWIGSAADELVVSPSALVGSIGVIMVHMDESKFDEQAGFTYTTLTAGKYKGEGNPYEPLSEEAAAAIQAILDEFYGQFVNAVAKGRGVKASDVRSGFGEGRVVTAKNAVALGMANRVDTLDGVLAKLTGRKGARASARAEGPADQLVALGTPAALVQVATGSFLQTLAAHVGPLATLGAATGDTAPAVHLIPAPAPKAKEHAMPEQPAAPTPGSDNSVTVADLQAKVAKMERYNALRKLAPDFAAELTQAEEKGLDPQAAADTVLQLQRQKIQPLARVGGPNDSGALPNEAKRGFGSVGEHMMAVVNAGKGLRPDPRLLWGNDQAMAVASGMNESVGSEGGFFMQPDLLPGVIDPVFENDPIVSRLNRIPVSGTGIKYNVVDETSRADGSRWGGIQMYWAAEADTATAKKPKMRRMQLELKKLIGIAYLTDELTADAPAAEALLLRAFQSELGFMLADGAFRGTGSGQMQGFLNTPALVTQAIEGSETLANQSQYLALNLTKMLTSIPPSLYGKLIWLYNSEMLPYLFTATVSGTAGTVPVWVGQGGLAGAPYATILGSPAFASELCEAPGTPGDILAIVPSEYDIIDKGGPQSAFSLHYRFINDENTFRITYRTDGAPRWIAQVTKKKGSGKWSPFVQLNTRS